MKVLKPLLLCGSLALWTAGCTTMSVTKLQSRSTDDCEQHAEIDGLRLGAHPTMEKGEVDQIFKVNLLAKGILPILLVAENHSPSTSFILSKEKIYVMSEATHAASTSQPKDVTSGMRTAGGLMFLTAPSLLGLKMMSDATVIQHNLADKEFYSRTLGPGQTAQGFVYFQFPDSAPPMGSYHVVAEVRNSATNVPVLFDLAVTLPGTKP